MPQAAPDENPQAAPSRVFYPLGDSLRVPKIAALFRVVVVAGLLLISLLVTMPSPLISWVLAGYLGHALVGAVLVFNKLNHPLRLPFFVSVDILMIDFFSWAMGALTSPVAILFVPMVIAFAVQKRRRVAAWVAGLSSLSFLIIVVAEGLGWIPFAPYSLNSSLESQHLSFSLAYGFVVVASILGSFFFVSSIFERLETSYTKEQEQRLKTLQQRERAMELERRLDGLKRLESLGRLAGGIAHDFNNLLTGIIGYTQLSLDKLQDKQDPHEELHEILQASRRAADLTKQLLAFSRRQAMKRHTLDLNQAINETLRMLARIIGDQVRLKFEPCPQSLYVKADISQLEQVILNLAVNARDAMRGGGELLIRTTLYQIDAQQASQHNELQPGRYARWLVIDTGSGMDSATLSEVFEPFFTTKPFGEGTGLGLSTVYGILKQHGGHIHMRSTLGEGTQVEILLPISDDAPQASVVQAALPAELPVSDTQLGRIVVVEDEELVRRYTMRVLRHAGFVVEGASSADQALQLFATESVPPDLVLSDVAMPGLSGPAMMAKLRAIHPGLKVLFMSGYPRDELVQHGLHEAALDFIQKPFRDDELLLAVRVALGENKAS